MIQEEPYIERRAEWCRRLRSGKIKQAEGSLRKNGAFCCLGVACNIFNPQAWLSPAKASLETGYPMSEWAWIEGLLDGDPKLETSSLPLHVEEWFGITSGEAGDLAEMNDEGYTFKQIADAIESGEICTWKYDHEPAKRHKKGRYI